MQLRKSQFEKDTFKQQPVSYFFAVNRLTVFALKNCRSSYFIAKQIWLHAGVSEITPHRNKLLCQLLRELRQQWISAKIKVWHPWQLKKSKSWGPLRSYQLNSSANSANLPQKWAKWAKLAVLISWQLQNGPQDFGFLNWHGCQTLILAEIHCYLSTRVIFILEILYYQKAYQTT